MDTRKHNYPPVVEISAVVSGCGGYRYVLRRVWDRNRPLVLFIGLNPSTADAQQDDPTCSVCAGYARRWGYGGILVANLFAWRATLPKDLYAAEKPVGSRNNGWLKKLHKEAGMTLCVWGFHGAYRGRDKEVLAFLGDTYCLSILKNGYPGHPLYKSRALHPIPYRV